MCGRSKREGGGEVLSSDPGSEASPPVRCHRSHRRERAAVGGQKVAQRPRAERRLRERRLERRRAHDQIAWARVGVDVVVVVVVVVVVLVVV